MKKILLLFIVFFVSCISCFAFDYKTSCHYLDGISGLSTSADSMGCMSEYKMLGSGRSNLAYYTEGSKSKIDKVYLVLNVYNGTNKLSVHNSLIQASKLLSKKAINYKLPPVIIGNLKNGKSGIWKYKGKRIEVKRDNWPTGLGYEVHFIIWEK